MLCLSLCTSCHQFNCCQCTKFIHFLTCTGIPCRDSHCENCLVRCCLYTSRRLQQTAVSCKRSNCNKKKEKTILKVARLRLYPKTANNGFPRSIMPLCMKLICGLSLNYHELHQELLHCHQLEEELDDWCHF